MNKLIFIQEQVQMLLYIVIVIYTSNQNKDNAIELKKQILQKITKYSIKQIMNSLRQKGILTKVLQGINLVLLKWQLSKCMSRNQKKILKKRFQASRKKMELMTPEINRLLLRILLSYRRKQKKLVHTFPKSSSWKKPQS